MDLFTLSGYFSSIGNGCKESILALHSLSENYCMMVEYAATLHGFF